MLDLGFESLLDNEWLEDSQTDTMAYELELELKDDSVYIEQLFIRIKEAMVGCENLINVKKIIDETNDLSDDFKLLVGASFENIGISLDNKYAASESIGSATVKGVQWIVKMIEKAIAAVKDFLKKYLGFQKIRRVQLRKKLQHLRKWILIKLKIKKLKPYTVKHCAILQLKTLCLLV